MTDTVVDEVGLGVEQRRKIPAVPLNRFRRLLIIGLGGIGTALLPHLCRYLTYSGAGGKVPLVLLDGDDFEVRNRERQDFSATGNKARVKAQEMRRLFPELSIRGISEFVTSENAAFYLEEQSLILLGVDNHESRKVVSDQCERLSSVLLVSGGNEWSDGNVQIFLRWKGRQWTPPLTRFHPEIAEAADAEELFSCDRAARSGEPQLLFTNLTVAAHMLNTLYAATTGGLSYEEVYFDIILGESVSIDRQALYAE